MSLSPAIAVESFPATVSLAAGTATRAQNRRTIFFIGLLSVVATLVLQIWRPFFYLTDDNLSGYLPGVVEISRKLWAGQWPFVNDHIYGGNYNLLADPSCFGLLSPWLLLFSWVALTPYYYALADIVSLCNSIAIACSFGWAALWFRREFKLPAPDWLIVILSLSYAFTPYNMIVGSSWIGFLNGQASFPLILVGFYHRSHIRGILLQAVALAYSLFGGHAHTFLVLCLFSGLVAILVSIGSRAWTPALRLLAAAALFGVVALPLIWPSFAGFQASPRAAGVTTKNASISRIPFVPLASSYFLGPVGTLYSRGLGVHGADPVFNLSIAFAFANIGLLVCLAFVRRLSVLSVGMMVCFLAAGLMVIRPQWLADSLSYVPLLRSLQWPFRELWLMHFAAHVFLLLNYRAVAPMVLAVTAAVSTLFFSGIFFNKPPTFYLFESDRQLVISGEADRYWAKLVKDNGTQPRVIVGIDPRFQYYFRDEIPFTLLGTYLFGSLYDFVSLSGYTFTLAPSNVVKANQPRPYAFPGAYLPKDARALWLQDRSVWRIDLVRVQPAEWTISYGDRVRRFRLTEETGEVVELGESPRPPGEVAPAPASPAPTKTP